MFTLFFAGNDLAPKLVIEGVPVQEYLQSHFINAIKQVALKLKDLPNVVGYDILNELSSGFIGEKDLNQRPQGIPVFIGETPTIFQSMLMGAGHAQIVDDYKLGLIDFKKTSTHVANPKAETVWLPGREDIWKMHGVWGEDAAGHPVLYKADYFSQVDERELNFYTDYYKPFVNRYAREIRSIAAEIIIFVEGVRSQGELTWNDADAQNVVHAPHWYDGMTLLRKSFSSWMTVDPYTRKMIFGSRRVRRCLIGQIASIVRQTDEHMNHAPLLIGEVGIPFDMQAKRAYRTGDFSMQIKALDATMAALEQNFVSFTLWNYTADNSNARGDQWNNEDLSLFSRDQMSGSGSIHDGGRALQAAVRPYPLRIAGEPLSMRFDIQRTIFEFTFCHDGKINAPTEIFIPEFQYPQGYDVVVSDGTYELDLVRQVLSYQHTSELELHFIQVRPV
jgi:hypothetical protein